VDRLSRPCARAALWIACLASLAPRAAPAWGPDGHRIIGEIAWRELTPASRRALRDLLPAGRYATLAEASVWADTEARRIPGDRWLEPYHFVDTDPTARHVDAPDDCTCVLAGIARFGRELRAPDPYRERVVALRLLAHFVGDVHQPLHVTGMDGHGGTRIHVVFLGRRQTLHQVWDSGLIERQLGRRRPQSWARELSRSISDAERSRWTADLDPRAWADESLALARRHTFRIRDGARLGDDYYEREIPVVAERLQRAGVRLGALLNGIFDPVRSMH
jgi:hypothetical protein